MDGCLLWIVGSLAGEGERELELGKFLVAGILEDARKLVGREANFGRNSV